MKLRTLIGVMIGAMLLVPAAFAASTTVINGVAYAGPTMHDPPLEGAEVWVECNGVNTQDTTDENGVYKVAFYDDACPLGSTATACVGDSCASAEVNGELTDLNITEIKLFGIPEFGAALPLAIAGAGLGFLALRRRK